MDRISQLCIIALFLLFGFGTSGQHSENASRPTLYVFLSDECVITQYYVTTLNEISAQYSDEVNMVAIFPNFSSKPKKIEAFYDKYQLAIPHRTDYYKELCRSLNATITPEAILLDSQGKIKYQGRIDNSYVAIGKRRRVVTAQELEDAIVNLLAGKKIEVSETEAVGCFINFSDKISSSQSSQY